MFPQKTVNNNTFSCLFRSCNGKFQFYINRLKYLSLNGSTRVKSIINILKPFCLCRVVIIPFCFNIVSESNQTPYSCFTALKQLAYVFHKTLCLIGILFFLSKKNINLFQWILYKDKLLNDKCKLHTIITFYNYLAWIPAIKLIYEAAHRNDFSDSFSASRRIRNP